MEYLKAKHNQHYDYAKKVHLKEKKVHLRAKKFGEEEKSSQKVKMMAP